MFGTFAGNKNVNQTQINRRSDFKNGRIEINHINLLNQYKSGVKTIPRYLQQHLIDRNLTSAAPFVMKSNIMNSLLAGLGIVVTSLLSCTQVQKNNDHHMSSQLAASSIVQNDDIKTDTATFGTGCFWCTEAIFQQLEGVLKVESGYSGGTVANPTYEDVCTGNTGHAEVVNIVYDPSKITFDELLEVFWQTHDPTTLNRQGNDVGTQYRSAIFYHNEEQRKKAEAYKAELDKSKAWDNPIVTEIKPFTKFYIAENYHQDYFDNNGSQPYCYYVIRPKLDKFKKVFHDKLKK
jgi:peptide-methionine (S)-S-oxide reductase